MKIYVDQNYYERSCTMIIEVRRGDRRTFIGMKDGHLIEQSMPDTGVFVPIEPLLKMDSYMMDEFIKAVVDYASGHNVVTENENMLKGKLEATQNHLEDMREISKMLLPKLVEAKAKE